MKITKLNAAFKGFLTIAFTLVLSGCVSSTKNYKPGKPLNADQGVLVTKLHSNWTSYKSPILADLMYVFEPTHNQGPGYRLLFSKPEDLKVISLPAGTYKWFRVVLGSNYSDLHGGFTIQPGKITYIGDIHTEVHLRSKSGWGSVTITDATQETISDLELQYAELIQNHEFTTEQTNLVPMRSY